MNHKHFVAGVLFILLIQPCTFSAEKSRNNNFELSLEKTYEMLNKGCQNFLIIQNFIKESNGYVFPRDLYEDARSNNKSAKRRTDNNVDENVHKKSKKDQNKESIFAKIWEIGAIEKQITKIKDVGFSHSTYRSIQKLLNNLNNKKKKIACFSAGAVLYIPQYSDLFNVFSQEEKRRTLILAQYLLHFKNAENENITKFTIDENLDLKAHQNNYNILIKKTIKAKNSLSYISNRVKKVCEKRKLL